MYVDEVRGRWHRPVGRVGRVGLWALSLAALLVAPCAARASDAAAPDLPAKVLPFVEKGRAVLAFKEAPTDEAGVNNLVFVTRHAPPEATPAPTEGPVEYTCELVALREDRNGIRVTGRTTEAVQCSGNRTNLQAGFRELDDNLTLVGNELRFKNYCNTVRAGWFTYSFRFEGGRWRFSASEASWDSVNEDGFNMEVTQSISERDIRLTFMEDFSRAGLRDALRSSRLAKVDYRGLLNIKPEASERAAGIRTSYARCMDRAEADFFAIIECSNVEYLFQDERLNASYKRRMASLGENEKEKLRAEERLWIKARDSYCNSNEFGGVTSRAVIASCHMFQTAYRAMTLEHAASLQVTAARAGVVR
ncbi:lysozyme inhibitor LprI family protein [Luteibacter sp. 3190]|uniref:lysozyme inhibitor LprI family protein n=1 Tax=Luteibacter sp. 3190 TaxID=2817736 RepID=UPI00285FD8B8|nr:lysozyme inhibitor LprI family protein [Luteibacter sp. 3190]MDR6938203.1 uncharacterized protein YecT (DUF1311 family) [Luteibacter sp. 3190]